MQHLNENIVIWSTDVEEYPHNRKRTDEYFLGENRIVWLDLALAKGILPGEYGRNWHPYIQSRITGIQFS